VIRLEVFDALWGAQSQFVAATVHKGQPLTETEYKEALKAFAPLRYKVSDIQTFFYDFRRMLMNEFLGEVFDHTLPKRKPKDPKYKNLSELATKKVVEQRRQARIRKVKESVKSG
jgi:hypothetical protein